MHRVSAARWISRAMRLAEKPALNAVPLFLCPSAHSRYHTSVATLRQSRHATSPCPAQQQRRNHAVAEFHDTDLTEDPVSLVPKRQLPVNCSGCGAFSQTHDAMQLGFYDVEQQRIRKWLRPKKSETQDVETSEDQVISDALKNLGEERLRELGLDAGSLVPANRETRAGPETVEKQPLCDRCHNLIHHRGSSDAASVQMYHPTVESLRETIEESPYKYNHIYHVIDAADFPMSLVPRLHLLIGDIALRTQNRRSRSAKFYRDRKLEMSFIITRGDLLGPTKEQVDTMMPYLREVLRDALGRVGHRVRLGNVRCVSAKRGWWTKTLKEEIWDRGGAGWMVGKVNVGKSQLFEAVYPKGRMVDAKVRETALAIYPRDVAGTETLPWEDEERRKDLHVGNLLPPPQPAKNYPDMPIVSSLPGTTASPIRVPFGNGKGELIDLPGLARSDLELFVKPEHRNSMVMKSRIIPEQHSLTSKSSLLLGGGLIRITPRSPDVVFLMYNFTPLDEHLTNTAKAAELQNQTVVPKGITNITLDGSGDKMKHAGTFKLKHDVTKRRAGPLTRKEAVGLQVERLPFRVLSVDILIEGVGYVEIVAQVRAKDLEIAKAQDRDSRSTAVSDDPFAAMKDQRRDDMAVPPPTKPQEPQEPPWPSVDVYTPEGRFVDSRQPIQGWLANKPLVRQEHKKSRPRKSMKGMKKQEKVAKRAANLV